MPGSSWYKYLVLRLCSGENLNERWSGFEVGALGNRKREGWMDVVYVVAPRIIVDSIKPLVSCSSRTLSYQLPHTR